ERWPSGLRRTPGTRVGRKPSQVRILFSPPNNLSKTSTNLRKSLSKIFYFSKILNLTFCAK
ncbi:MAG: hypothetical protein Q4A27_02085, partial [bacterium]|nr:hypothetical protein [bacterium]